MIWDERPLGPVWTHIEALGRVFGRFCLWGICMRYDDYSDTDIELQWYSMGYRQLLRYSMGYRQFIQWYRYGIQISYWDTEIQWYRYEIQTVDIQMRYRPLGPVWVHTEALGRVLGRFCPLGTRLCMHSYDEIWDSISLSIRCSSGAWRYPDSTSLPVRWGPDMTRLFPWVLVWW